MLIIWILAPCAVLMGVGFLIAFIWSVRRGQMDDLVTPPLRMLLGEEKLESQKERNNGCR